MFYADCLPARHSILHAWSRGSSASDILCFQPGRSDALKLRTAGAQLFRDHRSGFLSRNLQSLLPWCRAHLDKDGSALGHECRFGYYDSGIQGVLARHQPQAFPWEVVANNHRSYLSFDLNSWEQCRADFPMESGIASPSRKWFY
jgi:hypothetical protein